MFRHVARFVFSHPGRSLAGLAALGLWAAVAVNATAFQSGPHPAPLLGHADDRGVHLAMPRPSPRTGNVEILADPETEAERLRQEREETALVRDLQELLARRGFYDGDIDGRAGQGTEEAIRSFQQQAGLAVTGKPTVALLAQIQLSSYVAPPVPPANPLRADDGADGEDNDPGLPSMSTLTGDDLALTAPDSAGDPSDPRVEAVQRVLADLGYAPGRIDGQMGPQTAAAIRRFEEDRGMEPTGEITERLVRELSAVSGRSLG